MRKSPWTTTGSRGGGRCSRSHQRPSSIAGCGSPTSSSSSTSRSTVAASRNGSRSGGRAWIFASSSAICSGSCSGTGRADDAASDRLALQPLHHERLAPVEVLDVRDRPRHLHLVPRTPPARPRTRGAARACAGGSRRRPRAARAAARRRRRPPTPPSTRRPAAAPARRSGRAPPRVPRACLRSSPLWRTGASACARSWRSTSTRTSAALTREDDAADALVRELQQKVEGRGPLGAAPAAGGGRLGQRLPRVRRPQRGDRPQLHRAADLRLPGAGRGQRRDPPPLRHRRAEGAVPAAARRRRGALLLRHDRAGGGRLRPDAAARAGRAGRRRVGDRRAQVVLVGSRRRGVRRS